MTSRFGLSNLKQTIKQYVDQWAPRAGYLRTSGLNFRRMRERKVFCIGRNKTGTTSIKKALSDLGYRVGNQRQAERLIRHYRDRDFGPIIEYCHTAEAFQDVPFSWPFTYIVLDQAFPESKFILSVRDPDAWYNSHIRHQKQVVGTDALPAREQLKQHEYVWRGWLYDAKVWRGRPPDDLYNEEILKDRFTRYNNNVKDYFRFRKNFICIDVSKDASYKRICDFLNVEPQYDEMPHENKTQ